MEKRNADGLTEAEFLAAYNPSDYERPSVTVDMMVLRMKKRFENLQILLIQRKNHPYIEQWALPGGFIEIDESAYNAACRELNEEAGLTDVYMEQIYTMSQPDRDPRMRVIDIAYMALLPYGTKSEAKAGDDAKDALWFDIIFNKDKLELRNTERNVVIEYDLTKKKTFVNGRVKITNSIPVSTSEEKLAYDHVNIVLEGLMRLQNKVMYTDVAFNLVPEEFTLVDLQRAYEVIIGKDLYKTNFRNQIESKVKETGNKAKPITSNRIAKTYEYEG